MCVQMLCVHGRTAGSRPAPLTQPLLSSAAYSLNSAAATSCASINSSRLVCMRAPTMQWNIGNSWNGESTRGGWVGVGCMNGWAWMWACIFASVVLRASVAGCLCIRRADSLSLNPGRVVQTLLHITHKCLGACLARAFVSNRAFHSWNITKEN